VFDRITLVVGTRHIEKAIKLIPEWWCILHAVERGDSILLEPHRPGALNPSPPYLVAQLLWKAEAIAVLEKFKLASGWRSKTVDLIHRRLAEELPFPELAKQVRESLKRRAGWL